MAAVARGTGLAQLLQVQAVCSQVLDKLTADDRRKLRLVSRDVSGDVDRVMDVLHADDDSAQGALDSGLLGRLSSLSKVAYTYRGASYPLSRLLLALQDRGIKGFELTHDPPLTSAPRFLALRDALSCATTLIWRGCRLEAEDLLLLGTMTQLRRLDLLRVASDGAVNVGDLKALSQLTSCCFTVDGTDLTAATPLVDWGALLPHLPLLEVCTLFSASFNSLLYLGALPKLRTLTCQMHEDEDEIAGGMLDAERLLPLATFPVLERATLAFAVVNDEDVPKLQQVMSRMTAMTSLHFRIFDAANCLPVLPRLASLRKLHLDLKCWTDPGDLTCEAFDDAFVVQLAKGLTQLTALVIDSSQRHPATDVGFIAAAKHFRRLKTIEYYESGSAGNPLSDLTRASQLALALYSPSLTQVAFGSAAGTGGMSPVGLQQVAALVEREGCEIRGAIRGARYRIDEVRDDD